MKSIITMFLLLSLFTISGEEIFQQIKVKGIFKSVKVSEKEIGIRCKYGVKQINRIIFIDDAGDKVLELPTVFVEKNNVTYITIPEKAVKMKLYFDDGHNNVLYLYRR